MIKILIIDDDKELTELLVEFLSKYKYKLDVFHNPIEGLEFLKKGESDMDLLDIMMPEMEGFQV